ncbi:hypothetical protein Dsin_032069 [Dipteronia sinensis]|uniref:Wall-associated receptor kinase galacturonan-binding domain-containing protein n=1 Tax=Dipteronia sinensis TaxID=43782 RepID=A0AAD9ZN44_9ROSI|nr:hypothetical protein Dsin_032069 [Dipteronia sinensis]
MLVQLLFQIIFLFLPIISLPISKPNCLSSCGNVSIPFPFGIGSNCYLNDSFAVDCMYDHKPFLRSINLEVLNITIPDLAIRVNHPVLNSCLSNESTLLENTPYLFSDRNRFASVACDNFAILSSNNSSLCGCLSICDESQSFEMGNCFGVKCCQTTIPTKLKSYKTSYNMLKQRQKCKYAFLVDLDLFSTSNISAEDVQISNKSQFY